MTCRACLRRLDADLVDRLALKPNFADGNVECSELNRTNRCPLSLPATPSSRRLVICHGEYRVRQPLFEAWIVAELLEKLRVVLQHADDHFLKCAVVLE